MKRRYGEPTRIRYDGGQEFNRSVVAATSLSDSEHAIQNSFSNRPKKAAMATSLQHRPVEVRNVHNDGREFAFAATQWQVIVLFVVYGLFYSIDEAQSKAFIADTELRHRASAIGVYNFATGIFDLPASLIAGGDCGYLIRQAPSSWRQRGLC